MRCSGGNVNCFLPGVGVYVDDRQEGTTGREKWLELFQEMSTSPPSNGSLCPMLANHLILHAESLSSSALSISPPIAILMSSYWRLAFVPSLLRYYYLLLYTCCAASQIERKKESPSGSFLEWGIVQQYMRSIYSVNRAEQKQRPSTVKVRNVVVHYCQFLLMKLPFLANLTPYEFVILFGVCALERSS